MGRWQLRVVSTVLAAKECGTARGSGLAETGLMGYRKTRLWGRETRLWGRETRLGVHNRGLRNINEALRNINEVLVKETRISGS